MENDLNFRPDPGAQSPADGTATRIVSISIRVTDQDQAIRFFTEVPGFNLVSDVEAWPGARWVELSLPDSDVTVALLPPDSEIPIAIRLETPDAEAAYRRMNDAGVLLHNEHVLHLDGTRRCSTSATPTATTSSISNRPGLRPSPTSPPEKTSPGSDPDPHNPDPRLGWIPTTHSSPSNSPVSA